MEINYDQRGLVPAVVQDVVTGEVLMVAWMNAAALERTRETGQAHFWSRSRGELWHKGATSGNVMQVQAILVDCDADTLLLKVQPAGPACHTGERTCFFRSDSFPAAGDGERRWQSFGLLGNWEATSMLQKLFTIIEDRKANPRPGSYTLQLIEMGEDSILQKIGEETTEMLLAAKGQGDQRLIEEMADLFYHSLVLLSFRGLTLEQVEDELARRAGENQSR